MKNLGTGLIILIAKKYSSFLSASEARKVLKFGGLIDDDEVKEIFSGEAVSRKLSDLCAFCLLWRSPKRFLCHKFSLWGTGLGGRSVSA